MNYLILKQNHKHMTIRDQFQDGVKLRPHRLETVSKAAVIKDNQIIAVYDLNLTNLSYNAVSGRIDINSLLAEQDLHSDLINQHVIYETSSPATIKDPNALLT